MQAPLNQSPNQLEKSTVQKETNMTLKKLVLLIAMT